MPCESHDGKLVYYSKAESSAVWQVPVAGGEETEVLKSVYSAFAFAVADRGIYILPSGEAAVRFLDFRTRAMRLIATLGQLQVRDLAVSPDGRTIGYAQFDNRGSDLMLVENFR